MFTEKINLFTTYTDSQILTDIVADGSALAGVTPIGYDESRMENMADKLIEANPINDVDVSYEIKAESEYDYRGVPTNNKLVTVEIEGEKDYFVPNYLSYGERFKVATDAVVRVETPVASNGVLSNSFMTNHQMVLPFVTSSVGHRNPSYVTWFINYFLSPEYNHLYDCSFGNTKSEEFITDYAVCMGFDRYSSYQHGHMGWSDYLKSSSAEYDGWFKCNNMSEAQAYADNGMAVVFVQETNTPKLSVVIPSQGDINSNQVRIAYADTENKNSYICNYNEIKNNEYAFYTHY